MDSYASKTILENFTLLWRVLGGVVMYSKSFNFRDIGIILKNKNHQKHVLEVLKKIGQHLVSTKSC